MLPKNTEPGTEVIVKPIINRMLYAMIGRSDLVERWWHTKNLAFDGKTPDQIYQVDANGRKSVYNYVSFHCNAGGGS